MSRPWASQTVAAKSPILTMGDRAVLLTAIAISSVRAASSCLTTSTRIGSNERAIAVPSLQLLCGQLLSRGEVGWVRTHPTRLIRRESTISRDNSASDHPRLVRRQKESNAGDVFGLAHRKGITFELGFDDLPLRSRSRRIRIVAEALFYPIGHDQPWTDGIRTDFVLGIFASQRF